MAKAIDLTNQRFGKLLVLERDYEEPKNHPNERQAWWKCKCDCGNIKSFRASVIKKATSCGCEKYLNRQPLTENQKHNISLGLLNSPKKKNQINNSSLNLIGKKFGKLTVLEQTDIRKNKNVVWKCQCDCGNITYAITNSLTKGNTKSCGCIKSFGEEKISQLLKENNISFEREKQFNNCRFPDTNKMARFDFFVNNKYIIEFDGKQHFEVNNFFEQNLEDIQKHDNFKNNWCKENNIPIIRIPYYQLNNLTIKDIILK